MNLIKTSSVKLSLRVLLFLFLSFGVVADHISVWQGQYYTGEILHQGTYQFNFTVYNAKENGTSCYTNTTTISTGVFGEWKTEQEGVGAACNNMDHNYFLEIKIDNVTQGERLRLTSWNYLRKDAEEVLTHPITFEDYIYGVGDLKIGGGGISHIINKSGFVRELFENQDDSSDTAVIYTLQNDQGNQFSFALTSSNYNLTQQYAGENRSNLGVISLNAPNSMQFLNRWGYPFIWRVAEGGNLSPQKEPMRLEANGNLFITGNLTAIEGGFSEVKSWRANIIDLFVKNLNFTGNINGTGNVNTTGDISLGGNLTIGGQIFTDKGCFITQANFWAEEAGGISSSGGPAGLEYSFGDSNINSEGPRQPCAGKVVYATIQAENAANGDGEVDIVVNGDTNSSCQITTPTVDHGSTQTDCYLEFNAGDRLAPRTVITPHGQNNGYLVSWWVVYD